MPSDAASAFTKSSFVGCIISQKGPLLQIGWLLAPQCVQIWMHQRLTRIPIRPATQLSAAQTGRGTSWPLRLLKPTELHLINFGRHHGWPVVILGLCRHARGFSPQIVDLPSRLLGRLLEPGGLGLRRPFSFLDISKRLFDGLA